MDPEPNWLTFNSFRSGDMTAALPGADYPDLFVNIDDICTLFCKEGNLTVSARIGNQGYAPILKDVQLVLYGETSSGDVELASLTVSGGILPGVLSETVEFVLKGVETSDLSDIRLEVDGGNNAAENSYYDECDEENNAHYWGGTLCE